MAPYTPSTATAPSAVIDHTYIHKHECTDDCSVDDHHCEWPSCPKTFKRSAETERHYSNVHLSIRPYGCPWENCTKRFAQKPNLKTHINAIHTKERPHACNVCELAFADPSCLTRHRWEQHGLRGKRSSTAAATTMKRTRKNRSKRGVEAFVMPSLAMYSMPALSPSPAPSLSSESSESSSSSLSSASTDDLSPEDWALLAALPTFPEPSDSFYAPPIDTFCAPAYDSMAFPTCDAFCVQSFNGTEGIFNPQSFNASLMPPNFNCSVFPPSDFSTPMFMAPPMGEKNLWMAASMFSGPF